VQLGELGAHWNGHVILLLSFFLNFVLTRYFLKRWLLRRQGSAVRHAYF